MRRVLIPSVLAVARIAHSDTNADVVPPEPTEIPIARPVVPLDDTRSHGPTARNWVDVSATPALLTADGTKTFQLTTQLAVGFPRVGAREVRDLYDRYSLDDYQFRLRHELFAGEQSENGGPLTFALQRYLPISRLAIDPLVFAHVGIEAALSTPWLSGREVVPVAAVQILDGPDTELADNGWSIRPASAYLRADFLACRSESVELGLEPEAFVPLDRRNEYGVRFHVAAGFSLGCQGNMSPYAPKITLEYRGRVRMYAGDDGVDYRDNLGMGVQLDLGPFMLQAFYRADPGRFGRAAAFGLRLQVGKENKR